MSIRLIPMGALRSEKGVDYTRTHIYRLIKAGDFPRPIRLGSNRIAFVESEIDAYIAAKIRERDNLGEAA